MGSSFFEFSIVKTGLFAAKAGLETTSHNIANSSTKGYTRQVIDQKAAGSLKNYNGIGMIGTGTNIYGIGQVRDVYLDKKYWAQNSTFGEYDQKLSQLSVLETVFNDLTKNGLTPQLNDFFKSLSNLSSSSNDTDYKTSVINNANSILSTLKTYGTSIQKQQEYINEDIYAVVTQINTIAKQVAGLNRQIYEYELDGSKANDLRDQRALLIDELSKYGNIETKSYKDPLGNEKITILINGQQLVNNNESRVLSCERRTALKNPNDKPGLYDIKWETGEDFDLSGLSGELRGLLDVRDGTGNDYKGIPYYMSRLNTFVRTFAIAMNEGTDLKGNKLEGVTGHKDAFNTKGETDIVFFSYIQKDGTINDGKAIDYETDIDIFNITISTELKENPANMATLKTADSNDLSDNSIVIGFESLGTNKNLFSEGGIYQYVNSISSTLGIETKQSENFQKYYEDMSGVIESQRLQVSGVSLNEEIANVLKYQHLYQTASKLMNTINEIYNITINGLGV